MLLEDKDTLKYRDLNLLDSFTGETVARLTENLLRKDICPNCRVWDKNKNGELNARVILENWEISYKNGWFFRYKKCPLCNFQKDIS